MLSIFKKKTIPERPDLSALVSDMHAHLLPGIDDGAQTTAASLELLEGLIDLGYSKFIATPHILWDIYKNDKSTIAPAHQQLQQAMLGQNIRVPLRYAAEYFLDYHVDELIEEETPLLTFHNNWVLVEFSFISAPLDLREKLFALQMAGYEPVIAHPERYVYFAHHLNMYDELKQAGYRFQVNLLSLAGYYGRNAYDLAQHLVKNKYVELLGTDIHHTRHLHALQSAPQLTDTVKFLLDAGVLLNPTL